MGFKPPSENDTKDIKERLSTVLETVDNFDRVSIDIKEVNTTEPLVTTTGIPVMKRRLIKIELTAYTEDYPNPESKKVEYDH